MTDLSSLDVNPFDNCPPGLFYGGGCYQYILDQLNHFAQFGNEPVVILGVAGSGKTTLSQKLCSSATATYVAINSTSTLDDVLAQACMQWGISLAKSDRASVVTAIEHYCHSEEVSSLQVCIDDAHLLSSVDLESLLEICSLIPLVPFLFCDSKFENAFKQSVELVLEPLSVKEVEQYTAFLCGCAEVDKFSLTEQEVVLLREKSEGYPGKLLPLVKDLFAERVKEEKVSASGGSAFPLLHAFALVVLVVALLVLWLGVKEDPFVSVESTALSDSSLGGGIDVGKSPSHQNAASTVGESKLQSSEVLEQESDASVAALNSSLEALQDEILEEEKNLREESAAEILKSEVLEQEVIVPVVVGEEIAENNTAELAAIKEPEGEVAVSAAVDSGSQENDDLQWLRRQGDEDFTLQLMGAYDEASLRRMAARFGDRPLYVLPTVRGGSPWFILVHGVYSSSALARRDMKGLPSGLKQSSPWPKKFADIKKQL